MLFQKDIFFWGGGGDAEDIKACKILIVEILFAFPNTLESLYNFVWGP